jgi:hypothetical protein
LQGWHGDCSERGLKRGYDMQLREQAIPQKDTQKELPVIQNTALHGMTPGPIEPSASPSRTPVETVEPLVPQSQLQPQGQRVLVSWDGMVIVATELSRDRHIMILNTTRLTPCIGIHVTVRRVGSVDGIVNQVHLPWLVHNVEGRVDHTGAFTRLTLIR